MSPLSNWKITRRWENPMNQETGEVFDGTLYEVSFDEGVNEEVVRHRVYQGVTDTAKQVFSNKKWPSGVFLTALSQDQWEEIDKAVLERVQQRVTALIQKGEFRDDMDLPHLKEAI